MQRMIGLGDAKSKFRVYIANRPDYADLKHIDDVRPVAEHEINRIGQHCGNGWRKVFNVYAKLVFALKSDLHPNLGAYQTWQQWRDNCLLRENSNNLLLFSKPELTKPVVSEPVLAEQQRAKPTFSNMHIDADTDITNDTDRDTLHIIMGKGWAKECLPENSALTGSLNWLNQDFAVIESQNIIVCPYFDYRQLSNQKIMFLCDLIRSQINKTQ